MSKRRKKAKNRKLTDKLNEGIASRLENTKTFNLDEFMSFLKARQRPKTDWARGTRVIRLLKHERFPD